jgi:hypothetical protein
MWSSSIRVDVPDNPVENLIQIYGVSANSTTSEHIVYQPSRGTTKLFRELGG